MSDERPARAWAADGWLFVSDAPPETVVPTETERWIAAAETIEVRQ
jgi:hypothetical protein